MKEYRKVIKRYEEQMKFFEIDLKQLNDNISIQRNKQINKRIEFVHYPQVH